MSSLRKFIFAVAGIALAFPTLARAADLIEYIPPPEPIPFGGWYLRGDIGVKIYQPPQAKFNANNIGNFRNEHLDSTFVVGAGVGYRWNEWFRTDLTLDYELKAGFHGEAICPGACGGGYSRESADIDAWTTMVNAYFDIGTWQGITPYVGAGVGMAYLRTSNVKYWNPDGSSGTYSGDGKWNFAWALMAGASYELTPNMTLDGGYQFRSLGSAQTKVIGSVPPGTERIKYEDIYAHEMRLGLRYNFN